MVFNECPPGDAGFDATKKSLEMTFRWAIRSKDRFDEFQNVRGGHRHKIDGRVER